MAPRNITRNFLVGNYGGGNGAIDNDDGSVYYRNNHNFLVYGHQKFKVGSIESYGNVMAYVSDFGANPWRATGHAIGQPNRMYDNYVVFNPVGSQQYHNQDEWNATNNTLFGSHVVLPSVQRQSEPVLSLEQWQAKDPKHHDVGSTVTTTLPVGADIIAEAKKLLQG